MRGSAFKVVFAIVFALGSIVLKAQDTLHLDFHHTQVTVPDSIQKKIENWAKGLNGQHVNISVYGYFHRPEFKKFAQQRCDEMFLVLNRKARSLITIDFIGPKKGEDYQRTRVDIVYSNLAVAAKAAADKAAAEVAEKEKAALEKAEQKAKQAAEKAEKEKKELEEKENKKVAGSEKKAEEGKKKAEDNKEQAQEQKEKIEEHAKDEVKKTEEVVDETKTTPAASTDDSHLTEKERKAKAALEKKAKKKN